MKISQHLCFESVVEDSAYSFFYTIIFYYTTAHSLILLQEMKIGTKALELLIIFCDVTFLLNGTAFFVMPNKYIVLKYKSVAIFSEKL
jgi:hypothetical protein